MGDQNELLGVIDGHNDLPWASRNQTEYSVEGLSGVPAPSLFQTDVERMIRGGVAGQFWSVYAEDSDDVDAVQYTLEQITRLFSRNILRVLSDTDPQFSAASR